MPLTKQQLERRRSGIGASEIATLAGISPWGAPIEVWRSKVEGLQKDATYRMDLGSEVEAPFARVWARRRGLYLAQVDTLQHPAKRYALATPDRAVYLSATKRGDGRKLRPRVDDADMLLQVKSSSWRMRRQWGDGVKVYVDPGDDAPQFTDEIPDEYWVQVQWEMAVAGVHECAVIVDFDKTELFEFRVRFSAEIFGRLYDLAERFMRDHVEPKVPPPPDWSEQYATFVSARFPSERDRKAPLRPVMHDQQPELWAAIERLALMREVKARAALDVETARRVVELAIGDGAGLQWPERPGVPAGKVTWLKNKDSTVTDAAAQSAERGRIAGLAVMAMPEGDLRRQLELELAATATVFDRVRVGPRVLRLTYDWPEATPLAVEAGDVSFVPLLSEDQRRAMSAPHATDALAVPQNQPKEGTEP